MLLKVKEIKMQETTRSRNSFVTIVGRPNVGKSSLLNALIGEKIAAVSAKTQTTRTKITGVLTKGDTQYVFMDTPGMHTAKNKLSEHMINAVNESVSDIDVLLLVTDVSKKVSDTEKKLAASAGNNTKKVLILNKIDLISDKAELMNKIIEYSSLCSFDDVIPISVRDNDGLDIVLQAIDKYAVEGPHYFPDDMLTDQPEKVIMAEIIREKALNNLNEEIPHGIAVTIESLNERDSKSGEPILDIEATVFCERESHKRIVIGSKGSMLKKIGSDAREELEGFFEIKVNLNLWVKVKEGWRNREGMIRNFGLSDK